MRTLTQHIQESLNQKSIKDISKEKPVEEDLSDLMRTNPAKGGGIMRGTSRNEEGEED
ncbi:hypothetical protein [Flavobacterium lipolyticum]|uniref:Serine endopeptidase n=1 Tax=Flavobacterium lipolyticum TaxID=2893754 RepID=A0ABS8M419_9FLAO|nr:hypothetical protein [Flavobacterium sp. F-126]MCC9018951.1 hypothetical protein [Flavobacterium sp. F-126]